ncbi:Zn-ribbon domain-containing OB-fold protein [Candidatus Woesearchaeota archaeon]|nr:Zn-ribbon domain-containing OB-fold protein [Candidatus Woesearchaeota archaeon]
MLEKKLANQDCIRWPGKMPVSYIYTTGIAGEKFFKELKEKARISGTHCPKCRLVYLPPRLFCERCFSKLEQWKTAPKKGTIYSFTVTRVDLNGKPAEKPIIAAFITFKGFHGGIIHKIDEVLPEEVTIGTQVEPVFNDYKHRKGSILDIKYFRPV